MMRPVPPKTMSALFALAITIAAWGVASGDDSAEERTFPNFSLHTNAGEQWTLARQGRRPKLLMFWATWCPYCRRLFPEIQALHESYQSQGLVVAAISFGDDGDTLAYASQHGLTMTILDDGDALADEVGVVGTPTVILLDGDNRVTFETRNSDPADERLRDAVDSAVASYRNDEWTIYWMDIWNSKLREQVQGRFESGIGTFYGNEIYRGVPYRMRFLWKDITETAARWEQAYQDPKTGHWETNWTMDFYESDE